MIATLQRERREKRWRLRERDKSRAAALARALGVSETIASILLGRGVADERGAHRLLNPSHEHFHEPTLLRGMTEAVARVMRAIEAGERILIYGDYDVDGTMGTVVLRRALELVGGRTGFHVPHRFTEGYGINTDALRRAKEEGYSLIISCDCGIRAHEPLTWARENNLDVIITDHHLPDENLGSPPAIAVVNPNQKDCTYPDKHLAGVGVAWKLAQMILRERGREHLSKDFLKVVAIGTVADVAPLVGENRSIVALGLKDLPRAKNLGLRALMRVAGFEEGARFKNLSAYDLGFRIGPRINAAGRMDAARAVVELFEAQDEAEARRLAEHLDARNRERQAVQRDITERALRQLLEGDASESLVAVIAGDGWHRGVVGLAASRIAERLARPAVVISIDEDGAGHGSARSCGDYHLLEALTSCADLFEKFGGHAQAAGLTIRRENVAELRRRLHEHASLALAEQNLIEGFAPALDVDMELPLTKVSVELVREIARLEPFGAQWERPAFLAREVKIADEPRMIKERHLKLRVCDAEGRNFFDALAWNWSERGRATPRAGERIELVYALELNTWRDEPHAQLIVQDVKAVDS